MSHKLRLIAFAILFFAGLAHSQDYIPDELEGWQQWVLHDKAWRECPFYFDRSAAERGDFVCVWPGELSLDVSASGGRFSQAWTVYGENQWVALPGSERHWPDRVTANGRDIEVISRNGVPSVSLAPGRWQLAGRFAWDERPGVLRISPLSGLLDLTVDGAAVDRPDMNRRGVFLGEREEDTREADEVSVDVYRLVQDGVPTELLTFMEIDVSGGVREEEFGPVLPDGFIPMDLVSDLPARLESDGKLRLQVRPGTWEIRISARAQGVLDEIVAPPTGANLPDTEIWSYQSNNVLRITAPEGLPPVDPSQVYVPEDWMALAAFRIEPGSVLTIAERSRGMVSASNELHLDRTMWLDFAGDGFVVKDAVSGNMITDWRLDLGAPYALLSATESDESLLVTQGEEPDSTGVELRQTDVELEAIGRSETRGRMPATGWRTRFASVVTDLNLPPGHKLLAAPGVDNARGSWVENWALLDFFLVLIITIGVWRLFNPVAGIIALLALVLGFHEMLAPRWLWLNLLIAIALLRVAPPGRLFRLVRGYQLVSAVLLIIALDPFIAAQVRIAIYPQLEPQFARPAVMYDMAEPAAVRPDEAAQRERAAAMKVAPESDVVLEEIVVLSTKRAYSFSRYAPNAIVQAGPGIPAWRWNSYRLEWSGPVDPEQSMRLVVLPRWAVTIMRFLLVAVTGLFAAILAAEIVNRRWRLPGGLTLGRPGGASAAALVCLALGLSTGEPAVAEMPDKELLQQLEQRLLEPPACVPRCAEIAGATVDVGLESVRMDLSIHASEEVAIPLPGSAKGWRPTSVLVDGAGNTRVLRGARGALWIYVTPGRHQVSLAGGIPAVDSLEIAFPTPPRVVEARANGWMITGIQDRHLPSGSLQLTRLQTGGDDAVRWESSRFPVFVHVTRRVMMDLDWTVATFIDRVAPDVGALTLEVPLLDGESVVSGDFQVEDGKVLVTMGPSQESVSWNSRLPLTSPLLLRAPEGEFWTETWHFGVGSIWNVSFSGVPESNADNYSSGARRTEFAPRAGEELVVTATRPEANAGSTLAFDAVDIKVTHGNRSSDVELKLDYRSTRGAQHVVRLPADAEVTSARIDGQNQTLRAEDGELTLPILPGEHTVEIAWRAPGGMGFRTWSPEVDLGAPAGNIRTSLSRPSDRWLIATSGPQLGPAVLYWTELVVLLLAAVILGRIRLVPLATWQWVILGLGFSTFSWAALAAVVVWLFVCGARERFGVAALNWWQFNLLQVLIVGLTVIAMLSIISALPQGLLGTPDMHVVGYGSRAALLSWFADHSVAVLPRASLITVPMWIYKVLILAWALWLSFALVRWLPWAWNCFTRDGFWRQRNEVSDIT